MSVTVRRVLEYEVEVPEAVSQPKAEAAVEEAKLRSTAEAQRERFEAVEKQEEIS